MYTPQDFSFLNNIAGLSSQSINEHLGLYRGYVKNTNMLLEKLSDSELDPYAKAEMQRRFSFEFNGMKNHEYYFSDLSENAKALSESSSLYQKITDDFGLFDTWLSQFKQIAKTRGVGWAILYHDKNANRLVNAWVDEQHLGHLNSCQYIVGIDMWEHSFVADYQPSGKGQYIEDFFNNIDWTGPEERFRK